jgi:conjugative relaxase-like TrwC/TraI family protein
MFAHLSCNDYYSEGEKIVGHWHGTLAERFGVHNNEIKAEEFVSLQKRENPWTGGKLTLANRKGSPKFFDFQCSCQKSVSIMAVVMNDQRLADAHSQCVKAALTEMEKFAACRIRKGSMKNSEACEITGSMIAGLYEHNASRALDPQLHTHCVVANVTWSESEQRFKALSEHEVLKAIRYFGKYYQTAMARRVQELGYAIELKRTAKGIEGYEIKGVSEELLERYSRRRAEIEERMEAFKNDTGREPTAAEIHIIAKETREAKLAEITTPEVRESQRRMLTSEELAQLAAIKHQALKNDNEIQCLQREKIIQFFGRSIDHLFEGNSVVSGHELLAEALNMGMGKVVAEDLKEYLYSNHELVPLTVDNDPLQVFYTTRKGLSLEHESIKMANEGIEAFEPLGTLPDIDADDAANSDFAQLSDVQRQAVSGILNCKDFACLLRGYAGAGKTTALKPVHSGLIASEKKPLYLAPTRGAVQVLQKDGFENAATVAAFLLDAKAGRLNIDKDSVLIVDESSLMSAAVGHQIMAIAKSRNARIIFVGDRRQHLSVEAGDFLKVLEYYSNIKNFELSKIIRQIPENYRDAVQLMANARTGEGLERLNRLGVVEERGLYYLAAAALRYSGMMASGKKCLLVAPTHRELDTLNELVRQELGEKASLDLSRQVARNCFQDHNWTREQMSNIYTYEPGMVIRFNSPVFGTDLKKHDILTIEDVEPSGHLRLSNGCKVAPGQIKNNVSVGVMKQLDLAPGDKVLITANDKEHGLTNGDTGIVERITPAGEIHLTDGRIIPADFKSISYGYATTSHKSQGSTCDHAILAAAAMDDRACYVGSSRGRQSVKVYTPDFEHLLKNVRRNSDPLTAHDLIAARKPHIQELTNVQREAAKIDFPQEKKMEYSLTT